MLDLRRTYQILCGLGVQPPDVPCLCVTLAGAVQKVGLHILQGAHCVCHTSRNGLLTNECKERQPAVIFTVSPDAPFSSYTPENTPFKNEKLVISFETEEMMQDSLVLLRFNCPDSSCDHMATCWDDLKLHVRGVHKKFMWYASICTSVRISLNTLHSDLCIGHKKVFSHEHALYTSPQYFTHFPSAQRRQQKGVPKEQVEGGIHPLCEFCHECLFSDEELYNHMRHSHEECFICKRNEIRDK